MALLSILSKKAKFGFQKSNGEVLMDLELVENIKHTFITNISKEKGTLISTTDNLKNEPVKLSMICRISNNPISILANLQGVVSSVLPSNPLFQEFAGKYITKLSNKLLRNSTNRRQDFFDKLMEMRDNLIPFDVVTGLKVYQNMFFNLIDVDEDRTAENCLVFVVNMEKLALKSKNANQQSKLGFKKTKEVKTEEGSLLFETLSKFGGS